MQLKEAFAHVKAIQARFQLNQTQLSELYLAPDLEHILAAAHVGRWDQVTLLMIQNKVIDKWPS